MTGRIDTGENARTDQSRRSVLRVLGAAAIASLAGCSTGDTPTATGPESETATGTLTGSPTSTLTPTESDTPTDSPTPEPLAKSAWTADTLSGDVDELWLPNIPRTPQTTGGPLYAATDAGEVANLSVATGQIRWRFTAAGVPELGGHPQVYEEGSSLYVVSDRVDERPLRNYVEKLDPETGAREWLFESRHFLRPLGIVDGVLYLAGEYIRKPMSELGTHDDPAGDGRLFAVDEATGDVLWERSVPALADATVARHGLYLTVDPEDDSPEDTLVGMDLDGTERFRVDTGTVHLSRPVTTVDGVLAGAHGDSIAMFAPDGTEQWSVSGWEWGPSAVEVTADGIYVGSNPLVFLSRDGTVRWRLPDGGGMVRPSEDWRFLDTIYLAEGSRVSAVDPDTGTRRWSWSPEYDKYTHVQAVVNHGLVVDRGIGLTSEFVVLHEETGDVVGDFNAPQAYTSTAAVASRLFAGSTDTVYAFDVNAD